MRGRFLLSWASDFTQIGTFGFALRTLRLKQRRASIAAMGERKAHGQAQCLGGATDWFL